MCDWILTLNICVLTTELMDIFEQHFCLYFIVNEFFTDEIAVHSILTPQKVVVIQSMDKTCLWTRHFCIYALIYIC